MKRTWLLAALLACGTAHAQNATIPGLTARGTPAATDQFIVWPNGASRAQSSYASDLLTYIKAQIFSGVTAAGNLAKWSGSGVLAAGDLSGDVTTSGSLVTTLANTAVTPGSYTSANITVDAKGRITAAADGAGGSISALTGDVTASGTGSVAATVAQIQGTVVSGTTGTGAVVFGTSPTLATPNLGTPSAVNLSNATSLPLSAMPATAKIRSFGTSFGDTTGSALTSGSVVYFTVPYACTISAWNATVDAGTVTFDVWKIASGTAVPTVANTITAAALPAISTGTAKHSTTLTAWTTSVTANDIFAIQLNTVATAKYAEIDLECDQ